MTDRTSAKETQAAPHTPSPETPPADTKSGFAGEGNYPAARTYIDATRAFVKSGRVDAAAREAQPADEGEATELQLAEDAGRQRAKEEDPAVDRGKSRR